MKIAGNTLISLLFFLIVLGLLTKPVVDFYDAWKDRKAMTLTTQRLDNVNEAIRNYLVQNGHYPCPAFIGAPIDTPLFGRESTECNTAASGQTDLLVSDNNYNVRRGGVPVRALGLPDETSYDGYGNRYVYMVTEEFTASGKDFAKLQPAITLQDQNGTNATAELGNIVFAVLSHGDNIEGAYSKNGNPPTVNCGASGLTSENCDDDTVLVNTVYKSDSENPNLRFTQSIRYEATKPCEESTSLKPPVNLAYLLDTSMSMNQDTDCPEDSSYSSCTRMDVAQWALRQASLMRQDLMQKYAKDNTKPKLTTAMTGFIRSPDKEKNMDKLKDPTDGKYKLGKKEDVDTLLKDMCPDGNTPLGDHVSALSKRLDPTKGPMKITDDDVPNTIILISDGKENGGNKKIEDVVKQIAKKNEKKQGAVILHIIDMKGELDPELKALAEGTNPDETDPNKRGQYINTNSPEELRNYISMLSGQGTCPVNMKYKEVKKHCPKIDEEAKKKEKEKEKEKKKEEKKKDKKKKK